MSIELGVVPWSEHKLVIFSLMFHDELDASACHEIVEEIEFEESHPMMDMQDQLIKLMNYEQTIWCYIEEKFLDRM